MPTKTFTRVLTFGSYILLLFAIYGAIVVFSRSHNDTLRLETFVQCVNRPRGQPINSLKIDIRLEKINQNTRFLCPISQTCWL